ncbi:MAG TPA: hypothetical protein VEA80_17895 [Vitreimonas sp.]|uniref:hypothetical protein n=1 Tax=Vitreimonas sp. TaxID=3069702 RepID=UPI002D3DD86F|nr:hypothetical protein [Vitreimonas sp.]HYD89357.1 hypothetical protein [Vitreimonas sp.]
MKKLVFALAALAAACNPPAAQNEAPTQTATMLPIADGAGNRMEALIEDGSGRFCTGDGVWCVARDGVVTNGGQERARIAITADADREQGIWPAIIRQGRNDERIIVGVTNTASQMYSGGGGQATHVTLYGISGAAVAPILTAPLSGEITIRACFDEDDMRARREACHDEYKFAGALTLDTAVASGAPRLVLTTEATSYPGRRSRSSDSTQETPLQDTDLQRVRDETCSYRRVASEASGAYVWDAPLPACADYLEP